MVKEKLKTGSSTYQHPSIHEHEESQSLSQTHCFVSLWVGVRDCLEAFWGYWYMPEFETLSVI